jgi:hypothetical protein
MTSHILNSKVKSNGPPTDDCERRPGVKASEPAPDVIPAAPAQAGRHKADHPFAPPRPRTGLATDHPTPFYRSQMTLRAGTRALTFASRRVAYQQARTIAPKRFSSSAHSAPQSSDKPWMVRRRRLFLSLCQLELNSGLRARRLALRSSSFQRSGFRHCQRVTCTLTMEALHSL